MALADRAIRFLSRWASDPLEEGARDLVPFWQRAMVNKAYYDTEELYSRIRYGLSATGATPEAVDNIRSPAFRAVEFHTGHVMPGTLPGALPIKRDAAIGDAGARQIEALFALSNFSSRKQALVRTTTWSGNGFIKVPQREDRKPYLQVLKPQFVREFDTDDRGHLTYLRYSVPEKVGRGADAKVEWVTEVYSKEDQTISIWRKPYPLDEYKSEEGARVIPFSRLGIDFVPIVWVPFLETEPGKGTGVFEPFRGRIDNVNRAATRLHDMLFRYNRSVWALERAGTTPEGYELPPVQLEGSYSTSYTNLSDEDYEERFGRSRGTRHDDGTLTLGSDPMTSLPSGVTLRSLVPTVDYASALQIVNADIDDLATDMPELLYTKALDSAARDSSKVLQLQLAGAIDRAKEARGNIEAAIVRACQMAVTIGQRANIPEYRSLPTFQSTELAFEFENRPVVPPDPTEEAEEDQAKAAALVEQINMLRAAGYSSEVLKEKVARAIGVDVNKLTEASEAEGEGGLGASESALNRLLSGSQTAGSVSNGGNDQGRQNGDTQRV
jgi:hypothetical protein